MLRPENTSCSEARSSRPIPLQSALEAGSSVLRRVDRQLELGQPTARRDRGRARHMRRDACRHVLVELHHVVGRQLGELVGAPGFELVRLVSRMVRALVVRVGAQEGMDTLWAAGHVRVGRPRRAIPMLVLAWRI
jgi:hypothetical protein